MTHEREERLERLTQIVPKTKIIPNEAVMNFQGEQHERWMNATEKEQQKFLKGTWKTAIDK